MPYRHGAYVQEQATSLVTPVEAGAALPFVVGCAPVHNLTLAQGQTYPVNEPKLIYSFSDFVSVFGAPAAGESEEDYPLYQFAKVYIGRYGVAPVVFVNVFDPAAHRVAASTTSITLPAAGSVKVPELNVVPSTVAITLTTTTEPEEGSEDEPATTVTTYVEGTHYELSFDDGGHLVVTALTDSVSGDLMMPAGTALGFSASRMDPSAVAASDVIGGVSSAGVRTGLSLVHEVFPRFRMVPGTILAPKMSATPSVAIAIAAACTGISGHFRAMGIFDVPDTVASHTGVAGWLNASNLTLENCCCMYGNALYDGNVEPGSIHLAAVMARRDAANGDVPFWSPSNYQMLCEGLVHAGREIHLTALEAADLNGSGIVTGLNMIGGLRIWGDQTACFPGITDVKDASIPIRRMFNWIGNSLILSSWQFVSNPLRRRLIETVQDTFNCWLNGLVGKEYILGGRVTFEQGENPTTDLMQGKVTWHVYVTPPQAAKELTFLLEYDPSYFSTLFAG